MNSQIYKQFIENTFESMQHYQNESDSSYFFVEIPYIDTNKFNEFCNDHGINLQVVYYSMDDILLDISKHILDKTINIFDDSLQAFVKKHIERAEPIPIKARYAVICILANPTNYRTMGILGSCFKKQGENWKFYQFPIERPTDEELSQLDGIQYNLRKTHIIRYPYSRSTSMRSRQEFTLERRTS